MVLEGSPVGAPGGTSFLPSAGPRTTLWRSLAPPLGTLLMLCRQGNFPLDAKSHFFKEGWQIWRRQEHIRVPLLIHPICNIALTWHTTRHGIIAFKKGGELGNVYSISLGTLQLLAGIPQWMPPAPLQVCGHERCSIADVELLDHVHSSIQMNHRHLILAHQLS